MNEYGTKAFASLMYISMFLAMVTVAVPVSSLAVLKVSNTVNNESTLVKTTGCDTTTNDEIPCKTPEYCVDLADKPVPCLGSEPESTSNFISCVEGTKKMTSCPALPCSIQGANCSPPPPVKSD